jgi:hypothetical protein
MKKLFTKTYLLASLLLCSALFYAQSPSLAWAKKIIKTDASSTGGPQSIAVDTLGNIYTAGYFYGTYNFDPAATNYTLSCISQTGYILKQDALGNLLWAHKIDNNIDFNIAKIAVDKQNNVYVTGYYDGISDLDPTAGVSTFTANGLADCFIIKLNANGNFIWAKSFGGNSYDVGSNLAFDASNNVYILGSFYNTVDFNPDLGITNLTSNGDYDVFISKLDVNGNFLWVKSFGGNSADEGRGIQIDAQGNIYVNGAFQGAVDFDPNASTLTLSSIGATDIFMAKLNSAGNLVWAKSMGSSAYDNGTDLVLDKKGTNIYLTGQFENTVDFDPNIGTSNLTSLGSADIYISKFDTDGNLIWAKSFGGIVYEHVSGIKLDSIENIYLAGGYGNVVDFDPNSGVVNLTSNGSNDLYISKLDSNGVLVFAKSFGGTDFDLMKSIDIDKHGSIYTTGLFTGSVNFDPNSTFNLTTFNASDFDIYIQKLNQSSATSLNHIANHTNNVSLFPNPNNGTLHISLENKFSDIINISIINNLGEIVLETNFNTSALKLNTTQLVSGIYFARIIKNNEQEIIKFIKE